MLYKAMVPKLVCRRICFSKHKDLETPELGSLGWAQASEILTSSPSLPKA